VGEPAEAVQLLTPLANNDPRDVRTRRSLAQALAAAGQPEKAVQRLEEAHRAAPADAEVAYALATGYLRVKKVAAAEPLFASIVAQRPLAQTHVLIGRAYRDAGEFERARAELRRALKLDPGVRRAHYYLGTSIVQEAEDASRLDDAIREFRAELTLAPGDPLANLQLGMALVETRRLQEALPALELAARSGAEARAFYYLGRCQLGLDRPADAAVTLGRALELAQAQGASEAQIGSLQNQLGRAFRATGQTEKAAPHFAEAERLAARHLDSAREDLARYLASATDETKGATLAPTPDDSPFAALPQATRDELRRRTTAALARAYLNLGVMEAQAQRFDGAAELFEKAAAVDPDFPQVQHSLGVARFNAKQFDKAAEPLSRALASNPNDSSLKRMLALTWLDTRAYEKAAELLRDDPERRTNPSLEFSYGLALVHSNRVAEAEAIFSRLLAQHGDSAEINVVLGQAHAQEGDFERAVQFLTRALALKPGVAEANASLGVIYLKQGRLDEAEKALRGELAVTPTDVKSQQNLAVVLEMAQRPEEAIPLLRSVLQSKPDFTDARYLLGKILLAKGAAGEALEQLEAAVKAAPQDANIHYQLGRAYQTLGRTELAQQEFEVFRQLKEKR
jgi:tetratricopeptide (TPR) repeat protein